MSAESVTELKMLVVRQGERGHANWWASDFSTLIAGAFLALVFKRSVCPLDNTLSGPEDRRRLKDILALYGVKNALLRPSYRAPGQRRSDAGKADGGEE